MNKILHFAFLLIAISNMVQAQYKINDGTELLDLEKVPMEKMYLHHTASTIFSGEYLYYKLYCINAQTNRLSNISRMAYVILVNQKGEKVFEHKIRLEKGMGQGDFFLNTQVPTGKYKILAYTQWMKNSGINQMYQDEITIINPYQNTLEQTGFNSEIDLSKNISNATTTDETVESTDFLHLQMDTLFHATREKVQVHIRNYKGNLSYGNYSLYILKKNDLGIGKALSAEEFGQRYLEAEKSLPQTIGDSIFLPEQRGELVYGLVTDKQTGKPAVEKEVVLSIPGKEFILKSTVTNHNGIFFAYFRKHYKQSKIIAQVRDKGDFIISFQKQKDLDYSKLNFSKLTLNPSQTKVIVERSVRNQIENAFFGVKPDSILHSSTIDPFDGGLPEITHLDEYTRFSTLQETLIELLNNVGYRNAPNGEDYIRVTQDFEKFDEAYNNFPAIVLMDGVFIPNHWEIKNYPAAKIKTIKVIRDPLVLGANQYQGIVSFETFDGDFYENYHHKNSLNSVFELPKEKKNYYQQNHSGEQNKGNKRVPDYRYLLLWAPGIYLNDPLKTYEFYTSDVKGEFEVVLEGFTTYGKPISARTSFVVQ